MRILIFNQDWFAKQWREAGHEVVTAGPFDNLDYKLKTPLLHVDAVARDCGLSGPPDLIVYLDNSMPLSVIGLEQTSVPTIFYSVDAQHHIHWHKYLGAVCDLVFVAHRDYIPQFLAEGANAHWLPLWASKEPEASSEKIFDSLFVGTLNPNLNKDRVEFFEKLQLEAPVEVRQGGWWDLFPKAKLVINQTVKGDLNFRVFEAMASGSMLLTERGSNGLFDLFKEGEHFACYDKGDVTEAAAQIKKYIGADAERELIAKQGYDEVKRCHLESHRAKTVLEMAQALIKSKTRAKYLSAMVPYLYCSWRYEKGGSLPHTVLALAGALRALKLALNEKEPITDTHILYAALVCSEYDRIAQSTRGFDVLRDLLLVMPQNNMLKLIITRISLNTGRPELAQEIAKEFEMPERKVFELAEVVMQEVYSLKIGKLAYV